MSPRPVLVTVRARADIRGAVGYYRQQVGSAIALRLSDEFDFVFKRIDEFRGSGSQRYAHALTLPGLRSQLAGRFPFLIFYIEHADYIEIQRVLHAHRDIPASFRD